MGLGPAAMSNQSDWLPCTVHSENGEDADNEEGFQFNHYPKPPSFDLYIT